MNSHLKSPRQKSTVILLTLFFWFIGCTSQQKNQEQSQTSDSALDSGSEVSLTSDRSHLRDLRKEVPESVQNQNDELALVLQSMGDYSRKPSDVRANFDRVMRKKRETFNKLERSNRETFTNKQKAERAKFTEKQKSALDSFRKGKPKSNESTKFYSDQSNARRDFYGELDAIRKEFESEQKAKRGSFDEKMREQNREFSSQLQEYTKNYYEQKKGDTLKKRAQNKEKGLIKDGKATYPVTPKSPDEDIYQYELKQFDKIPKDAGVPLNPVETEN